MCLLAHSIANYLLYSHVRNLLQDALTHRLVFSFESLPNLVGEEEARDSEYKPAKP